MAGRADFAGAVGRVGEVAGLPSPPEGRAGFGFEADLCVDGLGRELVIGFR